MRVLVNGWWVTLENNPDTGKWDCPIPEESGWERDDLLLIELRGSKVRFVNLSEVRVHKSRFLRERRSLQRKFADPQHPLCRVLVLRKSQICQLAWPKCTKSVSAHGRLLRRNRWLLKIEER
jgi:hypothetical protein